MVMWIHFSKHSGSRKPESEALRDRLVLTCLSVVSWCVALAHKLPCAATHISEVTQSFLRCYFVRCNWQTPHQNPAWKRRAWVCLIWLCCCKDTKRTKGVFQSRVWEAAVRRVCSSLIPCLGLEKVEHAGIHCLFTDMWNRNVLCPILSCGGVHPCHTCQPERISRISLMQMKLKTVEL